MEVERVIRERPPATIWSAAIRGECGGLPGL